MEVTIKDLLADNVCTRVFFQVRPDFNSKPWCEVVDSVSSRISMRLSHDCLRIRLGVEESQGNRGREGW